MIKSYFIFLLLTAGIFFETTSNCAPLNEISESPDLEEAFEEDDLTTHTFDRLSSAATCLVAGVEYTHGQQIYRNDPCEFCLCLDGEMFCWWQDCPPTFEGPCRDRLPFSPCANGPKSTIESKVSLTTNLSSSKSTDVETTSNKIESSSTESTETEPQSETSTTVNVSETPSLCVVMGKTYQIGASLPHATGNCVECICGSGAQVTCSPHQCAPPGDDISDYRPPGPRPPLPDTF